MYSAVASQLLVPREGLSAGGVGAAEGALARVYSHMSPQLTIVAEAGTALTAAEFLGPGPALAELELVGEVLGDQGVGEPHQVAQLLQARRGGEGEGGRGREGEGGADDSEVF